MEMIQLHISTSSLTYSQLIYRKDHISSHKVHNITIESNKNQVICFIFIKSRLIYFINHNIIFMVVWL